MTRSMASPDTTSGPRHGALEGEQQRQAQPDHGGQADDEAGGRRPTPTTSAPALAIRAIPLATSVTT